jgi:uncharacterized MAPEG superfamily protein
MTIAYGCVLAAMILPYISTVLAKVGMKNFDNNAPRECLEQLQGWHKRAHWSQLNSFEAFPAFAAAVIIAQQLHLEQGLLDKLAISFIIARVFYTLCYLLGWSTLRSLAWFTGFGIVVSLFWLAM